MAQLRLTEGGARLATFANSKWIHFRVQMGHVHIGKDQQEVQSDEGLSIYPSDGLVSINWDRGELWAAGGESETVLEIILP